MSRSEIYALLGQENDIIVPVDKNRKKVKPVKVSRYWPGKAPEYSKERSDSDSDQSTDQVQVDDPRLKRIERASAVPETSARGRRRNHQTEILDLPPDRPDHLPTNETCANRRNVVTYSSPVCYSDDEIFNQSPSSKQVTSESEYTPSESEIEESEGEYATSIAKPVFVPKDSRQSVKERERQAAADYEFFEQERLRKLERQEESKQLVYKPETSMDDEAQEELPDDTDEIGGEEYELWKIRELKRIKRDYLEKIERERLAEEIKIRREMDDKEREIDNARIDAQKVKVEKGKMSFLQKYYHKGAFFMDKLDSGAEPIYARDFNAPVGEDLIDKESLPKVLQVRRGRFGKMSQTKHTHLKDVDTTDFSAWGKVSCKKGRESQVFERPRKKRG